MDNDPDLLFHSFSFSLAPRHRMLCGFRFHCPKQHASLPEFRQTPIRAYYQLFKLDASAAILTDRDPDREIVKFTNCYLFAQHKVCPKRVSLARLNYHHLGEILASPFEQGMHLLVIGVSCCKILGLASLICKTRSTKQR